MFAEKLPEPKDTTALVVSSTERGASEFAPAGILVAEEVSVTVSDVDCAKNETVITAVAVSPTKIASVAASIEIVSAFTAACDGIAENVAKDIAAAIPSASFLNEFIFLLVCFVPVL
jgi:hypothetical protein